MLKLLNLKDKASQLTKQKSDLKGDDNKLSSIPKDVLSNGVMEYLTRKEALLFLRRVSDKQKKSLEPLFKQKFGYFLLKYVVDSDEEKVEVILKNHPDLRLYKGNVTDYSNRTFTNITAFQLALWGFDERIWRILRKYLSQQEAAEQLAELELKSTPYKNHHDLSLLCETILTYRKYFLQSTEARFRHWNKIGHQQRLMPVHAAIYYANLFRRVFKLKKASELSYCHEDKQISWLPYISSDNNSTNFRTSKKGVYLAGGLFWYDFFPIPDLMLPERPVHLPHWEILDQTITGLNFYAEKNTQKLHALIHSLFPILISQLEPLHFLELVKKTKIISYIAEQPIEDFKPFFKALTRGAFEEKTAANSNLIVIIRNKALWEQLLKPDEKSVVVVKDIEKIRMVLAFLSVYRLDHKDYKETEVNEKEEIDEKETKLNNFELFSVLARKENAQEGIKFLLEQPFVSSRVFFVGVDFLQTKFSRKEDAMQISNELFALDDTTLLNLLRHENDELSLIALFQLFQPLFLKISNSNNTIQALEKLEALIRLQDVAQSVMDLENWKSVSGRTAKFNLPKIHGKRRQWKILCEQKQELKTTQELKSIPNIPTTSTRRSGEQDLPILSQSSPFTDTEEEKTSLVSTVPRVNLEEEFGNAIKRSRKRTCISLGITFFWILLTIILIFLPILLTAFGIGIIADVAFFIFPYAFIGGMFTGVVAGHRIYEHLKKTVYPWSSYQSLDDSSIAIAPIQINKVNENKEEKLVMPLQAQGRNIDLKGQFTGPSSYQVKLFHHIQEAQPPDTNMSLITSQSKPSEPSDYVVATSSLSERRTLKFVFS